MIVSQLASLYESISYLEEEYSKLLQENLELRRKLLILENNVIKGDEDEFNQF